MGRLRASSAPRNDRRARSDLPRRRLRGRAQTERAALPSAARECRPCRFFAPHRKKGSAAIPLLSAIARLDISSPREQGVRFAHGVAMSSQKNGAAILDKTKAYRPSDKEPFMNERQREYFRQKLLTWKEEILKEARETLAHLQAENENHPDLADRASSETDRAIELRARASRTAPTAIARRLASRSRSSGSRRAPSPRSRSRRRSVTSGASAFIATSEASRRESGLRVEWPSRENAARRQPPR